MPKEGEEREAATLLEKEFDVLIGRVRLEIPEDRRAELLVQFADLRTDITRLAGGLAAEDEPAAIYRPSVPETRT
ncbi:MAG: hypothetical protein ACREFP_02665 [Acetobacteraceae bacterium]